MNQTTTNTASMSSTAGFRVKGARRTMSVMAAFAAGLAALFAVAVSPALGAYGDRYGAETINGHQDAVESAPAIPGNYAFWAGACDRASSQAIGVDMTADGGFGARPGQVVAATGDTSAPQKLVDAPTVPDHCIDNGAPGIHGLQSIVWQSFPWSAPPVVSQEQNLPGCSLGSPCSFSPQWRLPAVTRAGSHPDGSTLFAWARNRDGMGTKSGNVDGSADNIAVDLPPGFVANPEAVTECTAEQFAVRPINCPPSSQVGILRLHLGAECFGTPCNYPNVSTWDTTTPVYNLEPRDGNPAELGFVAAEATTVRLVGRARTNGDYGITAFTGQIPAALVPIAQTITLWGVPWAAENDLWRTRFSGLTDDMPLVCTSTLGIGTGGEYISPRGLLPADQCQAPYDPSWGEIKPFFSAETDCNQSPTVRLATDAYQNPGGLNADGDPDIPEYPGLTNEGDPWRTYTSTSPPVTDCQSLGFSPDLDLAPTSSQADGASGLQAVLDVPQNNNAPANVSHDPGDVNDQSAGAPGHWRSDAGRATAHLDDSVVVLPDGVSVNPSAAAGLQACSDGGVGVRGFDGTNGRVLFNDGDPFDQDGAADGADCPDESKIGAVTVKTPLLAEELWGEVVLGEPKSTKPESGDMFRLFLVVRDVERGLVVKIYGSTVADPGSGRLTTTFANNPELPFDRLTLDVKGGSRGLLGLPQSCGSHGWTSQFTPWSGGASTTPAGGLAVDSGCGLGFSPGLDAGMATSQARGQGAFSFRFSRQDGEQRLAGLTARLPQGLLASVKDVALCSNAAANTGACPAGSKIGMVDAKAGSGDPFALEEKGEVFLTEGYKGAPYGLAVKIRPVAGPFRGAMELKPIIVRQKIDVDRKTAQVTAISDPLPLIHHGIPLRVREVTVLVNRDKFMVNPSDCAAKQIGADLTSEQGTNASQANGFQASGCAALRFKPRLTLALAGRKQTRTGKHPGIKAQVTQQGIGEAGIKEAVVRLPKSLALDVDNAQALCEFDQGTKPDLENHCPKGSIVGRARAVSPLLKQPLAGNVYFVKNVRRSSSGNLIRTLPMIIVALRGEIAINLTGESSTTKAGKLVNTFAAVPDAPVSRFNLNINGGRNGIIAVTRTRRSLIDLCAGRQVAEADMDGHNGKRYDRNIKMKTPCAKAKGKKGKGKKGRARRN
jgi:hypothetical protein